MQNDAEDLEKRIQLEQDRDRAIDALIRTIYIALGAFIVIWFVLSLVCLPG